MSTTNDASPPAVAGQVDCQVRPLAHEIWAANLNGYLAAENYHDIAADVRCPYVDQYRRAAWIDGWKQYFEITGRAMVCRLLDAA
jgi:ribosome modulation factor